MKHRVTRELGLALDAAIEEFTPEGVLDVLKHFDQWSGECFLLNSINTYQIAKYMFEGYEYPKTKEDSMKEFSKWIVDYNKHNPYPTKNSSYRRGRRHVLEEVVKKLKELKLS
ncbi:hypothetical protein BSK59_13640 [Paenibacillus odorifer]|uniref:hypothetical protein n=1 Tax=Paenibacillus odorifer TaxID=189426 RepID=UPI00096F52FB|nr:hypothetical protein [Paenibacillus odorifer]OME55514.1 hypothetical protein BSK59_13640 [Paenibacillus odorifer]